MMGAADGVHPEQIAGHVESCNLGLASSIDVVGFYMAEADGVELAKWIIFFEEGLIAFDAAPPADDLVQFLDFRGCESHGQAQGMHAAVRAACLWHRLAAQCFQFSEINSVHGRAAV
ncbi:hypothetical protein D9M73_264960 [compost metagenome]